MTAIELLDKMTKYATEYRKQSGESLKRNRHMNEILHDEDVDQRYIDAVLVDFINYVGVRHCVDYALYTKDFEGQ